MDERKHKPLPGNILCVRPANEWWRYIATLSLIGWAHTQIDLWHRRPNNDMGQPWLVGKVQNGLATLKTVNFFQLYSCPSQGTLPLHVQKLLKHCTVEPIKYFFHWSYKDFLSMVLLFLETKWWKINNNNMINRIRLFKNIEKIQQNLPLLNAWLPLVFQYKWHTSDDIRVHTDTEMALIMTKPFGYVRLSHARC